MSIQAGRFVALDGMRGIAAIVVVIWHCSLGFIPQITGLFEHLPAGESWQGRLSFILINGSGAVIFFFVLSGFVLTFRALNTGDSHQITTGVIKRWPRLALPVVISTVVSWGLFQFDLYAFEEAGVLSQSPWLVRFSYATEIPYDRSIVDAFAQGAFLTFFRGDAYFNSSLWTMRYEFIASMMLFGACYFILAVRRSTLLTVYLMIIAFAAACFVSMYYVSFLFGMLISVFYSYIRNINMIIRFGFMAIGLFCLAYIIPTGVFTIFSGVSNILVQSIGSALLIIAFINTVPSGAMNRLARWLGELSFPIYLIHIPVLASVGSAVYVLAYPEGGSVAAFYAIVATIAVTLIAAYPIMIVNRYWMRILNVFINKYIQNKKIYSASASLDRESL